MGCMGSKVNAGPKSRGEPSLRARSGVSFVSERITIMDGRVSHRTVGVSYYHSHTIGQSVTYREPTARLHQDDDHDDYNSVASMTRKSHKFDFTENKSKDDQRDNRLDRAVVYERGFEIDQHSYMKKSTFNEIELAGVIFNPEIQNQLMGNFKKSEEKPKRITDVASLLSSMKDPSNRENPLWRKINEAIQIQQSQKNNFLRTRTIHGKASPKHELIDPVEEEEDQEEEAPSPFKKAITQKFRRNSRNENQYNNPASPQLHHNSNNSKRRRSSILIGLDSIPKVRD